MEKSFSEWLANKLEEENLSQADFSRLSGISRPQISRIINGGRGVGEEGLNKIAKALNIAPDIVFRAANFLPKATTKKEEHEQLIHIYENLPSDKKIELLKLAKFFLDEYGKYKS